MAVDLETVIVIAEADQFDLRAGGVVGRRTEHQSSLCHRHGGRRVSASVGARAPSTRHQSVSALLAMTSPYQTAESLSTRSCVWKST